MDEPRLLRSLAALSARVKQLEAAVKKFESPVETESDEFPTRAGLDLNTAEIDPNVITESPFLQNCYENLQISRFCVGTWPDDKNLPNSICVQGLLCDAENKPYEFNRMVVFPALIKAQVPFSNVSTEPGVEGAQPAVVRNILQTCSSHLIQMTPNTHNIHEVITGAYLSGRGCENIHLVENGFSALFLGTVKCGPTNIIGPAHYPSLRERITEAHELFRALAPSARFHANFRDFRSSVLAKNPSNLKKASVSDVAERRQRWNHVLENHHPKTDVGYMVLAAFFAGTQSLQHGELALPVQAETMEKGEEWLGLVHMFRNLALVLKPSEQAPAENVMRHALHHTSFF